MDLKGAIRTRKQPGKLCWLMVSLVAAALEYDTCTKRVLLLHVVVRLASMGPSPAQYGCHPELELIDAAPEGVLLMMPLAE
eukprot:10515819-Lingulodinium_polyedra.AAC.1